ncbi:MAG TPA: glycosyltransferase [Acidimicrobiia bacterium]|nr:glycosyltransferase [Acidimicrobiia bacterium]
MHNELNGGRKKLSVLMPVYNESRTLRTIVAKVLSAPVDLELELIAVDDASADGSAALLEELASEDPRIRVFKHPVNRGKGAAIRTAISHATGDIAIVQDSDLEYDPSEYPKVLKPILDGRADAVYGSRFASSDERRVLFFWHSLGNKLLTALSNMANDLNLTDMETCYKAVRVDLLRSLRLTSERFGIEPEITARLSQWGARIYEVPISYHGRTYAEGKNIGWKDGVQALWLIFKFRFLDTHATVETAHETRQSLGKAPRFRGWVLDEFRPYLGEDVLEIDAGPGHLTSRLLDRRSLVSLERDPSHVETLHRRFGHLANLRVLRADLGHDDLADELHDRHDTVLLFDILQRSSEPKELLARAATGLRKGGHALIQVPADSRLMGVTDIAAGHVRRFDRDEVAELVAAAGLELIELKAFNRVGRLAWRAHHLLGVGRITRAQARAFDLLVPIARRIDRLGGDHGLSWLAVAKRP